MNGPTPAQSSLQPASRARRPVQPQLASSPLPGRGAHPAEGVMDLPPDRLPCPWGVLVQSGVPAGPDCLTGTVLMPAPVFPPQMQSPRQPRTGGVHPGDPEPDKRAAERFLRDGGLPAEEERVRTGCLGGKRYIPPPRPCSCDAAVTRQCHTRAAPLGLPRGHLGRSPAALVTLSPVPARDLPPFENGGCGWRGPW